MRSVVEIEVTGFGKAEDATGADAENLKRQRSLGSGVIVDPSGYIVTNNHVVAGALRIHVVLAPTTVELVMGGTKLSNPQRVFEATLVGTSRYADLAVIKIDAKDLPYIPLPEVYRIRLGQTVVAIGAPEGLDHTVTKGASSARSGDSRKSIDQWSMYRPMHRSIPATAEDRWSTGAVIWWASTPLFIARAAVARGWGLPFRSRWFALFTPSCVPMDLFLQSRSGPMHRPLHHHSRSG